MKTQAFVCLQTGVSSSAENIQIQSNIYKFKYFKNENNTDP